jgi:hypothetical protein
LKRYTTRFLKTTALVYMAFPAVYLLLATLIFDIPAGLTVRVLLSPFFWILSFLAALSGYGLWEMRRWSWYLFLIANVLAIYANAVVVSNYGESNHKVIAYIFSVAVILGVIYRVSKEVRVPYFLPKIRWWESNPRYKLVAPVALERSSGGALEGEILDLSMTGCFIKLKQDLLPDEPIQVRFTLFSHPIQTTGIVVWRTHSTVTHPKGVGVKFSPHPRNQRRAMRAIVIRLKKIAALYRSSRYLLSQEEFNRRLAELQNAPLKTPAPASLSAQRQ